MTRESIQLRPIVEADLDVLFEHQTDEEDHWRIAFTTRDPHDREAFNAHWLKILSDDTITLSAIVWRGELAGHLTHFLRDGTDEIGYWLGPKFSGKGIATQALQQFLETIETRPLFARAASDHSASLRVLAKCGFIEHQREVAYSKRRAADVEETVMILN